MKRILKIVTLFFISIVTISANDTFSVENIHSENQKYFAESIRYTKVLNFYYGQTKIFNSENRDFIYKIERYFDLRNTFLSNDGNAIISIDLMSDSIYHFINGQQNKVYSFAEVLNCNCDYEDCDLFYRNYEIRILDTNFKKLNKKYWNWWHFKRDSSYDKRIIFVYKPDADSNLILADKYNIFSNSDTLYIITPKLELLKFSLLTGIYSKTNFLSCADYIKGIAKINKMEENKFVYKYKSFPKLKKNISLYDEFGKRFNFIFTKKDNDYLRDTLMLYYLSFKGLLDRHGKFEILEIESSKDSITDQFKSFIESQEFENLDMPEIVDKWSYSELLYYYNRDTLQSIKEKRIVDSTYKEIHSRDLIADSIRGIYIPKDLDECNRQLDLLLKPRDKREIDSLESVDDMSNYHFGLGMWLRNNWGLWWGSRLSEYIRNMGIYHPDDMSSIILENYFCYRHKIKFDLESKVKHYKEYWEKNK